MKITRVRARDIRFPTSRNRDGSDALNFGDYSAAYVVLETDAGLEGHGLTFTNGRGNELAVAAFQAPSHVTGRSLEAITADMRAFYRSLTLDSQLRCQCWDVAEAIRQVKSLARLRPGGSRSPPAPTTSSGTPPSPGPWRPSARPQANPARTA